MKPVNPHDGQQTEELGLLALEDPVEPRVGAHDRAHVGLGDRRLEGGEVELVQGPLGDLVVEHPTVGLLVVDGEVLGHGHRAGGLDAIDVGHPHGRHQHRVLAVTLVGPTALRHPVDVEGRPLDGVDALAPGLGPLHHAVGQGRGRIEGGGDAQRRRQLGHVGVPVGQTLGPVLHGQ